MLPFLVIICCNNFLLPSLVIFSLSLRVFPSSQCVFVLTVCFRITVCLRHHSVFTSSQCVFVITVCFRHHSMLPSSQCFFFINLCFRHHSVCPSSQFVLYFSLAYLMDVFVLVILWILCVLNNVKKQFLSPYASFCPHPTSQQFLFVSLRVQIQAY